MDNKKIKIGIAIFVILIILSLVVLLTPRKNTTPDQDGINIPTIDTRIPTSFQTSPKQSNPQSPLEILSTTPQSSATEVYLPVTVVDFVFNDALDPRKFRYSVAPYVQTYIKIKGNTISIYPENIWKPGVTTITILKDTISISDRKLANEFLFKLNTNFPEEPLEDDHGY